MIPVSEFLAGMEDFLHSEERQQLITLPGQDKPVFYLDYKKIIAFNYKLAEYITTNPETALSWVRSANFTTLTAGGSKPNRRRDHDT